MKHYVMSVVGIVVLIGTLMGADAFAALSGTITIDPKGGVSKDRLIATVTGTYTCSPFTVFDPSVDFATINLDLRQASGQHSITEGFGFASNVICDGSEHTYVSLVPAENNPWRKGLAHATAQLHIQACDAAGENCEFFDATADETIKLKRLK